MQTNNNDFMCGKENKYWHLFIYFYALMIFKNSINKLLVNSFNDHGQDKIFVVEELILQISDDISAK